MTAPPPRRPWRKRKRTWAAVLLWLFLPPVLYVLCLGPIGYADQRGWISPRWRAPSAALYWPLFATGRPADFVEPYLGWWLDLGRRHAASL